ncbi:uncharacterized protein LOC123509799 isoform X3 [Portunus trituberculatus]|uniref:uncharacterized protein LOC123509799 isoform X3 n=1 Tax=Portunus trituberculatus TaxID=210409 RepID=UPI001E1CE408|nr:uncharacterized protein LOC123509799 isoform X3 [Portunus trituberculatus]
MAEGNGGAAGEPVAHRTRGALEELPRSTTITLHQSPPGRVGRQTWSATVNLPSSYLSPTPSPDELIIRERGRRSLPIEWSPIPIESPIKRTDKTPIKRSPTKGLIALRSSPRKRLQLSDASPKEILESRQRMMQLSPILKKCRSLTVSPAQSPPEVAIKGLSQNQLVDVLSHVLYRHPELKDEVSDILPQPDLKEMEEKLNLQKKCVFKSLPVSRLTSKTDSPAYNKAAPHLASFKRTLSEQCNQLVEAEQWVSLVDYSLLAWSYVRATPIWDSQQHNSCRRTCFKTLAQHCLQGLKKVNWLPERLESLLKKVEQCCSDHDEMQSCVDYLRTVLSNQV